MPRPQNQDVEFLHAALVGLEYKLAEVEQRIGALRGQLGEAPAVSAAPRVKRTMSAAARRRIALAQKKRWAVYKSRKNAATTPKMAPPKRAPAKRSMSAEGRARIVAATKKRWAAFRKKQQPANPVAKKTAAKNAPAKPTVPKTPVVKPPEVKAPAETLPETVAATPAAE